MRIRTDDTVVVIAGKDKGKTGEVIRTDPKRDRVFVEGLNMVKRAERPRSQGDLKNAQAGGIIEKEGPIDVSNVMLLVDQDGKKVPTRIGFRRDEVTKRRNDGSTYTAERSVRVSRRTGEEI